MSLVKIFHLDNSEIFEGALREFTESMSIIFDVYFDNTVLLTSVKEYVKDYIKELTEYKLIKDGITYFHYEGHLLGYESTIPLNEIFNYIEDFDLEVVGLINGVNKVSFEVCLPNTYGI